MGHITFKDKDLSKPFDYNGKKVVKITSDSKVLTLALPDTKAFTIVAENINHRTVIDKEIIYKGEKYRVTGSLANCISGNDDDAPGTRVDGWYSYGGKWYETSLHNHSGHEVMTFILLNFKITNANTLFELKELHGKFSLSFDIVHGSPRRSSAQTPQAWVNTIASEQPNFFYSTLIKAHLNYNLNHADGRIYDAYRYDNERTFVNKLFSPGTGDNFQLSAYSVNHSGDEDGQLSLVKNVTLKFTP